MADAISTTISGLRATTTPLASSIYQTTDYGGGQWYYDPLDTTSVDNTATIVKCTSTGAAFKRIYDGALNASWFGAKGDGISDDTASLQMAFNALNVLDNNLSFDYGIYNFDENLIVDSKQNIEIDFNNAVLFDLGKDIALTTKIVKTPVGITIKNCTNIKFLNLKRDGNAGSSGPILPESENQRVPALDFDNCKNLMVSGCEFRGSAGPFIKNLTLGPAHFMRASYLRFNNCSAVVVIENTVAKGCGNGEIFSFASTNYITWENCYHNQADSPVTIYSWGKVIDCNWVTIRGHKVQTASPGSFVDFLGTNLVFSDIVLNTHIDSKLIDLTAEWNLSGRTIENVRIVNCFTSGRGVTSAGGCVSVPIFKNIFVDNIHCKDGILNDDTNLMGFENIDDISLNNITINNIRSLFTAEIPDAIRDKANTYRFNNLIYNCTIKLAANVILHEANGLTEFRNSIFNINTFTTETKLEIRDRYSVYAHVPLTASRSLFRYINCIFNDAVINIGCNVAFIDCIFNNCKFDTNDVDTSTYRWNATILFDSCKFRYTDDPEISNTADGLLFFIRTLSKLSVLNCSFRGKTYNTGGAAMISVTSAATGDITIDNCTFDLIRTGATNPKYPGILRANNNHPARVNKVSNCIFSENMLYLAAINGAATPLPAGLVSINLTGNKFLSEGNTPILSTATDASRIAINLMDETYSSGLNLGSVTNYASQNIKINLRSSDPNPETLYDGGLGSTFQSNAVNGYSYIKQSANGKTGWIQLDVIKTGATGLRPTSRPIGFQYYDTTLLRPIWWNGTVWKDAAGNTV